MKQKILCIVLMLVLCTLIPAVSTAHTETNPYVRTLYAGQNIPVGKVSVWNDKDNLYIDYKMCGCWEIIETHLYVGKNVPLTSAPGQFPYKGKISFVIPLKEIYAWEKVGGKLVTNGTPGVNQLDCVHIAAHAVVYNKCCHNVETAWAKGLEFSKNWAMEFLYCIQGWEYRETVTVPAKGDKVTSITTLQEDGLYKFVAHETCNWRTPGSAGGYLADAEYWLRHDQYGEGWIKMNPGSVAIWNGVSPVNIDWGDYNSDHVYTYLYTPTSDGKITFYFYDDIYSDNSEYINVEIFEWK